jgi:hypothetical protein
VAYAHASLERGCETTDAKGSDQRCDKKPPAE